MRKKIVVLSTQFFRTERILPAVVELSKTHDIVICSLGNAGMWANPSNERASSIKQRIQSLCHHPKFELITNEALVNNDTEQTVWYESHISEALAKIDLHNVECVIYDDSRTAGHQIPKIIFESFYQKLRALSIPVIANIHGNVDNERLKKFVSIEFEKVYDKICIYGDYDRQRLTKLGLGEHVLLTGIPANDVIKDIRAEATADLTGRRHILVILNRIDMGNIRMNPSIIERMPINELWEHYKLPIIFKLKVPPSSLTDLANEEAALSSILKDLLTAGKFTSEVPIMIVEDDIEEDWLLLYSKAIIAYGSTMCFKALQAGIPTVIVREMGNIANFENYCGTFAMNENYLDVLVNPEKYKEQTEEFLRNTLKGSLEFNSTEIYVKSIYGVINEWKQKNTDQ